MHAASQLGVPVNGAATGRRVEFGGRSTRRRRRHRAPGRRQPGDRTLGVRADRARSTSGGRSDGTATVVPVRELSPAALEQVGVDRALALDPEELSAVQHHFVAEGREPTDVELETIAQTWSEHCAHKTFRASMITDDGARASAVDRRAAPMHRHDRRAVRQVGLRRQRRHRLLRPGTTIALKAETHNHPSAVEPFGGANTGVGGVIRDVLGIAHRPIAITDILCFGPPDTPLADVPEGALHPLRIREGVIDGVADYGNKIGLPTVAGAILYDPGLHHQPAGVRRLRRCRRRLRPIAGPLPGDRVVVLGGRTGRDGIRGATFSSLTMDATTG